MRILRPYSFLALQKYENMSKSNKIEAGWLIPRKKKTMPVIPGDKI